MRRTAIEESNGEHALVSAATLQMRGLVPGMRVEIRALLTPPQADAEVKARPDATVLDWHHRLVVLRERAVAVDALPREVLPQDPGD